MDGKPEDLKQLSAMTAEKGERQNLQEDGIAFQNTFGQLVQALSQSEQSNAAPLTTTAEDKVAAAPAIGEVEKHRIHEPVKSIEAEYDQKLEKTMVYCETIKNEMKKLKKMEACHKKTIKTMEDDCNQKLKIKDDDCNQKLKIKDDDCNQKLEKMKVEWKLKIKKVKDDCQQKLKKAKVDCNQELKIKDDDCNQELKTKDDDCNQKLEKMKVESKRKIKKVKDDCSQKIKEGEDDCNQKLKIKDDEYNQKLKNKEDDCNQKLKIKDDDCNQKIEKMNVDCNQKIKEGEDDCNQKLKIKDDDCNRQLQIKDDDCNRQLQTKEDDCNRQLQTKEDDCNRQLQIKDNDCNRQLQTKEDDCNRQLQIKDNECETLKRDFKKAQHLQRALQHRDSHLMNTVTELGKQNEHLTGENTRLQGDLDRAHRMTRLYLNRGTSAPPRTSTGTQVERTGCSRTLAVSVPSNQRNQQRLHLPRPIQEVVGGSHVLLSHQPSETAQVERIMYMRYWWLVFILSPVLGGDTAHFERWARRMINEQIPADLADVFVQLDDRRVISVENLQLLRQFFEEIQRYDLVDLVRQFQEGNYRGLYNAFRRLLRRAGNPNNQVLARVFGVPDGL